MQRREQYSCPLRIIPNPAARKFWQSVCRLRGVFVVLSILWGWQIDKVTPDRFDIIGGMAALAGVSIINVLA